MEEKKHCAVCGSEIVSVVSLEGSCPRCLFQLGLEASDLEVSLPEEMLANYDVSRRLGRGGMAEVYLAHDSKLGRDVALKVLPPDFIQDPQRRARLRREALAIAALNHPNICTVHDIVETDRCICIIMEFVEGTALDTVELAEEQIIPVVLEILSGLEAAHSQGIVHRDIKPSNLMVTSRGHVKIMDFGVAKLSGRSLPSSLGSQIDETTLTIDGQIIGTPAYMSPEQVRAEAVDHRSDLFSLGVVLYELLAGSRPFRGDTTAEVISSILRDRPPPLPTRYGMATHLQEVLDRALEKDPGQRYQSTSQFRDDLKEFSHPKIIGVTGTRTIRRGAWVGGALILTIMASWLMLQLPALFNDSPELQGRRELAPHELLLERASRLDGKFSATDNQQSIRIYEEVIRAVPDSSEAHARLALAKLKRYWWYQDDSKLMGEALNAAVQALNLEPGRLDARVIRAIANSLVSPATESYLELAQCLQEDPGQAEALGWLIYNFYAKTGDFAVAERLLARLNNEESEPYHTIVRAFLNIQKRDFASAREDVRLLQLQLPDSDAGAFLQRHAAVQAGNLAMLESALKSYEIIAPDKPSAAFARAYLAAKRDGTALDMSEYSRNLEADYELAAFFAQTQAVLGNDEEALTWLEHSVRLGNYNIVQLDHEDFEHLRSHPQLMNLRKSWQDDIGELTTQLDAFWKQ